MILGVGYETTVCVPVALANSIIIDGDGKVKISVDDTTPDYLFNKLSEGNGISLTETDPGSDESITIAVDESEIDHDSLLNHVPNDHIDHTSVDIATSSTSGLSGGGDISSTRNLVVSPNDATAATVASGDLVLIGDVDDSNNVKKVTAQSIADLSAVKIFSYALPSLSSTVVSQTTDSDFNFGEFTLSFDSPSIGTKALKMSVNNSSGDLTDSIYAKVGENINLDLLTQINAGNVELVCTNNENHEISLTISEIIF